MKQTLKITFMISVLLLLFLVHGVAAEQSYGYVKQWGSTGTGNGQFNYPWGVAVDTSGNVYVADTGNNRIQKFDSVGNYLTQWGSAGTGNKQFQDPFGVAVDALGNVYVVDEVNARIQKFDSVGNYLTQWGSFGTGNKQFDHPSYVAVDPSGNVYVADTGNDRIQKFDSDGNYLTQWGSHGSGNKQFRGPFGVAVDSSDNIYVVDQSNYRIQKFDSDGNYLTQWGSHGFGNDQFISAIAIAVDSSGNVFVTDNGIMRIQKFDSNKNYLAQWGSEGSGNGQFEYPQGIGIDPSGNVFVADSGNIYVGLNNRIQKFALITTLSVTSTPPGEEIFVDYKNIGYVTPYTITKIVPGSHIVQVNTPGSLDPPPLTYNVAVKAGEENSINFNLNRRLYILSNPPGSEIVFDGKKLGVFTPYLLTDISAGVHMVEIIPPGSTIPSTPYSVEIKEGEFTSIKIDLTIPSTPEFPSIFLPVTMIIGFLGAVLLIQRTREH